MNKKNLVLLLIFIIIFFIIGIIIYPIFYNSTDDLNTNPSSSRNFDKMMSIDLLSNLRFFKILVGETDSEYGAMYSEKFVTIRAIDSIEKLQEMLASAKPITLENPRGYDTPTTALCYLEDNSMYSFFVISPNVIVFSDSDYNKTIYELDSQYNIEEFLTTLYNVNVNSYKYSVSSKNGKYGVKYSTSQNIVEPIYDDVVIINSNVDVFAITQNGITTFIDKYMENPYPNFENVELVQSYTTGEYENVIKFIENNKYGLASLDGQILLPAEYDSIESSPSNENCLILTNNDTQTIIKLVPYGYEDISGDF